MGAESLIVKHDTLAEHVLDGRPLPRRWLRQPAKSTGAKGTKGTMEERLAAWGIVKL